MCISYNPLNAKVILSSEKFSITIVSIANSTPMMCIVDNFGENNLVKRNSRNSRNGAIDVLDLVRCSINSF